MRRERGEEGLERFHHQSEVWWSRGGRRWKGSEDELKDKVMRHSHVEQLTRGDVRKQCQIRPNTRQHYKSSTHFLPLSFHTAASRQCLSTAFYIPQLGYGDSVMRRGILERLRTSPIPIPILERVYFMKLSTLAAHIADKLLK